MFSALAHCALFQIDSPAFQKFFKFLEDEKSVEKIPLAKRWISVIKATVSILAADTKSLQINKNSNSNDKNSSTNESDNNHSNTPFPTTEKAEESNNNNNNKTSRLFQSLNCVVEAVCQSQFLHYFLPALLCASKLQHLASLKRLEEAWTKEYQTFPHALAEIYAQLASAIQYTLKEYSANSSGANSVGSLHLPSQVVIDIHEGFQRAYRQARETEYWLIALLALVIEARYLFSSNIVHHYDQETQKIQDAAVQSVLEVLQEEMNVLLHDMQCCGDESFDIVVIADAQQFLKNNSIQI